MAAFRYPLQAALERRRTAEEHDRRAYISAGHTLADARRLLEALRAAVSISTYRCTGDPVFAGILGEMERRAGALTGALRDAERRGAAAREDVAAARAQLQRSALRRVALERHRSRALQRFSDAQALREAAEVDERNVALARANSILR